MVWNHGFVSLAALGGTLLGHLKRHRWKTIIIFLLSTAFIIGMSIYYLSSALTIFQGETQNAQEYNFWHLPLFTPFYLGFLIVGFPIAVYKIFLWLKKKPVSQLDKVCLASLASMAIMIPMWADRWLQYSTIPLALLMLSQISQTKGNVRKLWYAIIVLFYFANGTFALSIRLLL